MNRLLSSLLAALGLALASAPLTAQIPCFHGDDGFNNGCCKPADPNLPDFPEIKVEGIYGCISDCKLEREFKVVVVLSRPEFTLCDTAVIHMDVFPQTPGGPTFSSDLIAKYSRTWLRVDGEKRQVWRFLLNGDWQFTPSADATDPCPVPPDPCPPHSIGSIDYACDEEAGLEAAIALNLSHLPGCLTHGQLSARPLPAATSHPDRSYHLVAPANFGFGVVSAIQGPFVEDAVRTSPFGNQFPCTYECLSEAPVRKGEMAQVFENCLCFDFGDAYVHSEMKGEVDCGGPFGFRTVGGFDPFVPTGLVGLRLGRWFGPTFPGDQELTVYAGYLAYDDPCVGPVPEDDPDRVFGVGTLGPAGLPFDSETGELEKVFLDLQDSLVQVPTNPTLFRKLFGAPAFSSRVWNLNPRP
jgi:hypothetical protein